MKIIQSFWSAGKDVYADGFGWKHPELHFMSWALSCLSLREHYDDVTLYTDSAGYDVLINKLRLPYTRRVTGDIQRYWPTRARASRLFTSIPTYTCRARCPNGWSAPRSWRRTANTARHIIKA